MFKNILFTLALLFLITGCNKSEKQIQTEESRFKKVYTVNYPLYYFTQRMAPQNVQVVFPVPDDVDPAFWQPNTEEILGFSQADLIIINGADYAKWRSTASLPESKLLNTSKAFQKELIHIKSSDHTHGPGGEHSHAGTAFTTWLDM
ncbi:MAG: zinc ABC transporter solute-binding protein, partial [Sulfurovum sp.]|nr:zinc ABC transporter solute-binding protein [Sulfurovum sp.]